MEAMCTERVQRDVRTFTALIAAYGNGGQWEWAEAAFDVMQKAEVQPNANTFTALVTAYGKGGQWELAEAAIAAMKELNLQTESNPVLTLPALLKRVCAVSCATRQPSPIRAPLSLSGASATCPQLSKRWAASCPPESTLELRFLLLRTKELFAVAQRRRISQGLLHTPQTESAPVAIRCIRLRRLQLRNSVASTV